MVVTTVFASGTHTLTTNDNVSFVAASQRKIVSDWCIVDDGATQEFAYKSNYPQN